VRIDLTTFPGEHIRLRFRFGTDGAATEEGWYIDDITLEGDFPAGVSDGSATAIQLSLARPRPNPASGSISLSFVQPVGPAASLTIVDVSGRRLVEWSFPPEQKAPALRQLRWDGGLGDGRKATSGVYFLRLRAGLQTRTQRLLWIR
jgi:hypothetical protein